MKYKFIVLLFINILMIISLSYSKSFDYFGMYFGPENSNMLFFNIADKDSATKTCFLSSEELGINNLESNNFILTKDDFFYSIYSDKIEVDIQTRRKSEHFEGGAKIDGFVGGSFIYKFDKETLNDMNKYCGTYYSIDKKDSIVISVNDSLSLVSSTMNKNNTKDINILYPISSEIFISKIGLNFDFKLRNTVPWQIMYIFEGKEYFFYKEL